MTMQRRDFLKAAGIVSAASVTASPAAHVAPTKRCAEHDDGEEESRICGQHECS